MPLILVSAVALVGLAMGDLGTNPGPLLAAAAALALLGAVLARGRGGWSLAAVAACALALGGLRAGAVHADQNARTLAEAALAEPYLGTAVRVDGTLLRPPTISASGTTLLMAIDGHDLAPAGREPRAAAAEASGQHLRLRVIADPWLFEAGPSLPSMEQATPSATPADTVVRPAAVEPYPSSSHPPGVESAASDPPGLDPLAVGAPEPRGATGDPRPVATAAPHPSPLDSPASSPGVNHAALLRPGLDRAALDHSESSAPAAHVPGNNGDAVNPQSPDPGSVDAARFAPRAVGPSPIGTPAVAPSPWPRFEAVDAQPLDPGAALAAGDRLVLEGKLLSGEAADAQPTLLFPTLLGVSRPAPAASSNPIDGLATWMTALRGQANARLHHALPEPEGSLAAGILLGGSGQLDAEFRLALQRSGLAHLLAIDGFKLIVVGGGLASLARNLVGPRWALIPTWLSVGSYTLLTGAHPSAVRAAFMLGLAGLAATTGRQSDPLTSLLLAVVAMATVEPPILLDLGLQLSVSATLGLILLWPFCRRALHRVRIFNRRLPRAIVEPAGLTLAVTLATLPVVLSVFQVVSLISPVAHIVAVPLLAPTMILAALVAITPQVDGLVRFVGWLAWLPTTLLVTIIRWTGSLPGAALSTGRLPPLASLTLATTLLVFGAWSLPDSRYVRRRIRQRCAQAPMVVRSLTIAGCAGALVALAACVRADGQVHVLELRAGRGDAVLVRSPTGQTALVARGRVQSTALVADVADHLALWEHKLDVVVPLDGAAAAGLAATLARYPPDRLVPADEDERVDLGGGAVLDLYTIEDPPAAAHVTLSFGQATLPLLDARSPTAVEGAEGLTLSNAARSSS